MLKDYAKIDIKDIWKKTEWNYLLLDLTWPWQVAIYDDKSEKNVEYVKMGQEFLHWEMSLGDGVIYIVKVSLYGCLWWPIWLMLWMNLGKILGKFCVMFVITSLL